MPPSVADANSTPTCFSRSASLSAPGANCEVSLARCTRCTGIGLAASQRAMASICSRLASAPKASIIGCGSGVGRLPSSLSDLTRRGSFR